MPITAFIGVRISWLMFARNSPLASFAASAAPSRLLELRDVVVDRVVALVLAVHDERHDVVPRPRRGSRPCDAVSRCDVPGLARSPCARCRPPSRARSPGTDQGVDGPPDRLLGVYPKSRAAAGSSRRPSIAIHRHHRDRADLYQRLEVLLLLAVALLRLLRSLEQPRVFDRDRRLLREPDEEVEVAAGEQRRRGAPPDGHHPDDLAACEEGSGHQSLLLVLFKTGIGTLLARRGARR